jgi:hypothetical protein
MEGGFFLDIVIRKGATVLKLLTSKDQALLVRGNALLVLDLGLDIVDSIGGLNFESDGLAGESLDEDLHVDGCSEVTVSVLGYVDEYYEVANGFAREM